MAEAQTGTFAVKVSYGCTYSHVASSSISGMAVHGGVSSPSSIVHDGRM
jgi:hypothetical protein